MWNRRISTLVIGGSGYLGGELLRQAAARGHDVVGTCTTGAGGRTALDVTDITAVHALLTAVRPTVVVNTAYRVDSWTVTADGAAHVALAAASVGARLVHLSTDALHAGRDSAYGDDEPPSPVHAYGAAKAAAETAVAAVDPGAVLVRTSLLVGDARSAQVTLALDLAAGRRRGALFTDEIRCPVAVQDVAAAVLELAASDYAGRINVAGPQALSRAELGRLVARRYGADPDRIPVCRTVEAGLPPRPGDVRLDISRASALLSTRLRPAAECV